MVIGIESVAMPALPMEGSLPPDLQGTFFRVGPGPLDSTTHVVRGALHAVELRDGRAVSFLQTDSDADAGVFWHAGALLALPETGLPSRYTRYLESEEFTGGLSAPIASHVHRVAADGSRVLFAVEESGGPDENNEDVVLRIGEWDARGALRSSQSIPLERATWQHDIGVTSAHVVFVESPTRRLVDHAVGFGAVGADGDVPFAWVPGADGWIGVTRRDGDGSGVRWTRVDPCLVTHVLGATDVGDGDVELYVCRYDAPVEGAPVDATAPVVGPEGIGLSAIGGSLAVLERWRLTDRTLTSTQLDERFVEYPRTDPQCDGASFRHGYCVETRWADETPPTGDVGTRSVPAPWGRSVMPVGVLKVDLHRDDATAWNPGAGRRPSEPVFVRAADGHQDDEGWLLTVVDDPDRGASDLYVLDASTLGRRPPEAVIHLPERLPFCSHGEWVSAEQYG